MKKMFSIVAMVVVMGVLVVSFTATKPISTAAALGEKLFFDTILSKDYSISCASCHNPKFGFADTAALSIGIPVFLYVKSVKKGSTWHETHFCLKISYPNF